MMLEKTPESPLDCKEFQTVHPKGNQSWVFIGRTDVKVETVILWPPDVKSWLIWKDPDAGKDWGQEKKGMTEDEMVGWHHRLYGHGFGWTPGVGDGQGGLACCSSWGHKESDMTERLNWTEFYDPIIPVPGIRSREMSVRIHQKDVQECSYNQKKKETTRCPSIIEWVNKLGAFLHCNTRQLFFK